MKLNLNSAKKGNASFTFSPTTLSTLDFGRLQPVRVLECLPGDSWNNVSGKGLLRCAPQVFPPFGRVNLKNATFFVPETQLISWSSALHANQTTYKGITCVMPWLESSWLNRICSSFTDMRTVVSTAPASVPSKSTYDFCFPSQTRSNTGLDFFKLTSKGWRFYSIMKALGYDFKSYRVMTTGEYLEGHLFSDVIRVNALPLLAYLKIFSDNYLNGPFINTNAITHFLQSIYLGKDYVTADRTVYTSSTGQITTLYLYDNILRTNLRVPFEQNFYSTAWNNVNNPCGIAQSGINADNVNGTSCYGQTYDSPIAFYGSNDLGERVTLDYANSANKHDSIAGAFSALGHKTLEAFDKYVRRKNLVGTKAVQQIYSAFGIKIDDVAKSYTHKICEGSSRVNFNAVVSTADTGSKGLGAYGGIGMSGYDINFNYKANGYGYIISLVWLNIDPIKMHGNDASVIRYNPLDFYTPEWDGKGYRPICNGELSGACAYPTGGTHDKDRAVFGYTNIYDDYRNMDDVVCGQFLDNTTKTFAFMRDYSIQLCDDAQAFKPQTNAMQNYYDLTTSGCTNPFTLAENLGDRFYFCVDWNINATRPILCSEDALDLSGVGETTVNKNDSGIA